MNELIGFEWSLDRRFHSIRIKSENSFELFPVELRKAIIAFGVSRWERERMQGRPNTSNWRNIYGFMTNDNGNGVCSCGSIALIHCLLFSCIVRSRCAFCRQVVVLCFYGKSTLGRKIWAKGRTKNDKSQIYTRHVLNFSPSECQVRLLQMCHTENDKRSLLYIYYILGTRIHRFSFSGSSAFPFYDFHNFRRQCKAFAVCQTFNVFGTKIRRLINSLAYHSYTLERNRAFHGLLSFHGEGRSGWCACVTNRLNVRERKKSEKDIASTVHFVWWKC